MLRNGIRGKVGGVPISIEITLKNFLLSFLDPRRVVNRLFCQRRHFVIVGRKRIWFAAQAKDDMTENF